MATSSSGRLSAGDDARRIVQVLQDLIAASSPAIPCHPARDAAIYLVVELEERARQARRALSPSSTPKNCRPAGGAA